MSKNYNLDDSERDDFTNFEKFTKKVKDKKEKKKSLRDLRGNDDKRKYDDKREPKKR